MDIWGLNAMRNNKIHKKVRINSLPQINVKWIKLTFSLLTWQVSALFSHICHTLSPLFLMMKDTNFRVLCKRGTTFPSVKRQIFLFNINIFLLYFLSRVSDFPLHQFLFVCCDEIPECSNDHERSCICPNMADSKYLREI